MESNRFCGKSCIGLAVTLQTSEATSSSDWLVLLLVALQWKSALLFNNHGNFFPLSLYIHYPLVFLCQHKWIIEHLPLQETQTKYMVEERIKTKFQGGDLCCKKYFWEGETPWCRQVFFFFFFKLKYDIANSWVWCSVSLWSLPFLLFNYIEVPLWSPLVNIFNFSGFS